MGTGMKGSINWNDVDKRLAEGSTGEEVAAFLGIHADTLYVHVKKEFGLGFTAYRAQKRAIGDSHLRAAQFKNAMKGNATMQIWLGKQRLKQKDNPDSTEEFNGNLATFLDKLQHIDIHDLKSIADKTHDIESELDSSKVIPAE